MAKIDRRDLGYLGEDFQYRLIHHFMLNPDFFVDLVNIIDQNMFTNPTLKTIVGVMKEHYFKEDSVPSYPILEIALRSKCHSIVEMEISLETLEKIQAIEEDDGDYVGELAFKFFRQQNIVKAANEILRLASSGDTAQYENVVDILNEAITQGVHEDLGSCVFEDVDETLSDDYRFTIPTGIDKIDEALEGGIAKGELGVIVGPSSFGKTSMTTALASHAATYIDEKRGITSGFKVLQIVFEDRVQQIRRKHIARLATLGLGRDIEARNLSKEGYVEEVREFVKTYPKQQMVDENLRIVRFRSGEVTANYIKKYIRRLIATGFKPDLVIVDYFECLSHVGEKSDGEYTKEGHTMRKFEAMANELDIAMWIPVQGTKDSFEKETLGMSDAGGSGKKVQVGHIILTIARTQEDVAKGRATLAIPKNRSGAAGGIFSNIKFNNGTCVIDCNDTEEFDIISFNQAKQKERTDTAKDIMKKIIRK